MPRLRISLATLMLLACAACGGSSDQAPTSRPSESSLSSASPAPSPSVSEELAGYSLPEREAFEAAVVALHRFSRTSDRFISQGRLTRSQAAYFRRNSINWVDAWAGLAQLVNGRITMRGDTHEKWARPSQVDLSAAKGEVVVIRRCLDQTDVRVFADGKRVPQPQLKTPRVYRVKMLKKQSEQRWRTGLPKQGSRC